MPSTPPRGTLVSALRREMARLVEALDARYRRQQGTANADDPYRDVRTARHLGGAGNFGGAPVDRDDAAGRDRPGRQS